MRTFEGTLTALVTPFRGGEIDETALRALVNAQIEGGIDGLVPCGTTGESVTLSKEEHVRVVRIVVEETKGRVPVVAGAGTNSTDKTIALARACAEVKADGLLLVTPYYNKPTQAGLAAHFRAVLAAVPLPAILYNVPSRTSVDLAAETLYSLRDVPNAVAVKEATGNSVRSQQILSLCEDRFTVLSGDDALTLPILSVGGRGVVSVASNAAPRHVGDVVRRYRGGDVEGARKLHLALLPFYDALFLETNPGPIKQLMADRKLVAPEARLPIVLPSRETCEKMRELVATSTKRVAAVHDEGLFA